ncbi:dienelactone hydrolase family protein [Marinobacter sp. SS21]|uniref:dienelactone hydrolase family protein n=1 Tax=Marinobacter sp. SS21 TaxID=2979460 RepID=UPI002330CC60|nr:dienelactone hydrolase family protein [Marinobacter sp. SS21]MDC0662219.1 dienelactone hydrolase family protein [Marinobacter sp. SS21]
MKAFAIPATALALMLVSATAQAELKSETVTYQVNGEDHTGYLAFDETLGETRPGILIVHEWWGHNDFVRQQADRLAREGYTAFALDMYGGGKVADHPDDARSFMQAATADAEQLRQRFVTALEWLQAHPTVAAGKIAAQGYCFGGAVVLNMARLGVDLAGVVSIHGALTGPIQAEPGQVRARVQVYTGGADQMVPASQVAQLVTEMQDAGVDLTLTSFPGVLHSFSNPAADALAERFGMPIGYDQAAAERTWQGTLAFYQDLFGR